MVDHNDIFFLVSRLGTCHIDMGSESSCMGDGAQGGRWLLVEVRDPGEVHVLPHPGRAGEGPLGGTQHDLQNLSVHYSDQGMREAWQMVQSLHPEKV